MIEEVIPRAENSGTWCKLIEQRATGFAGVTCKEKSEGQTMRFNRRSKVHLKMSTRPSHIASPDKHTEPTPS